METNPQLKQPPTRRNTVNSTFRTFFPIAHVRRAHLKTNQTKVQNVLTEAPANPNKIVKRNESVAAGLPSMP